MKNTNRYLLLAGFLVMLVAGLTGCVAGQPLVTPAEPTVSVPGLANPASVYCADNGGSVDIRSDAAGNQTGVCVFADGSECDEWAYFRSECAHGDQAAPTSEPEVANPMAAYCAQQGGSSQIVTDGSGNSYPACVLADGTVCQEAAFYNGECGPGGASPAVPAPTETVTATISAPAALMTAVLAALPADAYEGVEAIELDPLPGGAPLWAVYSSGMRNFDLDPTPGHIVAIYSPVAGGWNELARLDISNAAMSGDSLVEMGPDFVAAGGVAQADIDPSRIWLTVDGGAGAHSGTFQILSFDGETLQQEIGGASASPGAGYLADLNGDGQNDVVFNATEYYVFCYACGVRHPYFNVYTLLGDQMFPVEISALMMGQRGTPPDEANSNAVQLAQAGLWPDALAAIKQAVVLAGDEDPPTPSGSLRWNDALIQLNHDAQLAALQDSPYPLLSNVFYGDYAAAVDLMRALPVEQIFSPDSPLIAGTVAEGWQAELSSYLMQSAAAALDVKPELAPALLVRAWGAYLTDPADPQIAADLAAAAQLAPDDPLFAAAAQAFPIGGR